jgi:hypothetical protein
MGLMVTAKNLGRVAVDGNACRNGRSARTGLSALVAGASLLCALLLLGVLAATAGALATVAPTAKPGPTGLPDGRVYEQVSPQFKNGNYYEATLVFTTFGLGSADGNAIVYPMSGAVGEANAGLLTEYVSRRTPGHGWQTASAVSRPVGELNIESGPHMLIPSSDFSSFLFSSAYSYAQEDIETGGGSSGVNIFLGKDAFAEPTWLGKPLVSKPLPGQGSVLDESYFVAGASPNLETAYFTYTGTLVPEDKSREQYVVPSSAQNKALGPASRVDDPWGFYEWHAGALVSAGALPDGNFNPFGAVPAAIAGDDQFDRATFGGALYPETFDNEVSEDGSRAFFVSPDPTASEVTNPSECKNEPPCTSEAPQLYLREPGAGGGKVSKLISASQMPGHMGEAAPDGVIGMPNTGIRSSNGRHGITDAYASPDGSRVFFASADQLTAAAPSNSEVKIYEYQVESGSLTYMPGVTAPIAQVSHDGSEMLFENTASAPATLELWRNDESGGSTIPIAQLPGVGVLLNKAHISQDGSAVVFSTNAEIPGFNDAGGFNQVYRYALSANELTCVSCPPTGVAPSGSAHMSYNNQEEKTNGFEGVPTTTIEARGMSANGDRIFFDTPSPLVGQDTNGVRDAYEWENGTVYLISSGAGTESQYLENDTDGENFFFATQSGLDPGDSDEAYDIYDARIPRPGDNPPPAGVPCKGSVCQGPPSVPELLGPPASETFSGAGNVTSQPEATQKAKSKKAKKKKVKPRKKAKKKKHKVKAKRSRAARRTSKHVKHDKGRGN